MPIYEFYCPECHTIFNFLSKSVNTRKRPICPLCKKRRLERQVSMFAMTSCAGNVDATDDLPIDEGKMVGAIDTLASETQNINEDDPRQAAGLMRKFSKMTGVQFGKGMEEALHRIEAGEDPQKIEEEIGDLIKGDEEPFILSDGKGKGRKKSGSRKTAPHRDPTLYEMQ